MTSTMLRDELIVGRYVRRCCWRKRSVCQTCYLKLHSSLDRQPVQLTPQRRDVVSTRCHDLRWCDVQSCSRSTLAAVGRTFVTSSASLKRQRRRRRSRSSQLVSRAGRAAATSYCRPRRNPDQQVREMCSRMSDQRWNWVTVCDPATQWPGNPTTRRPSWPGDPVL